MNLVTTFALLVGLWEPEARPTGSPRPGLCDWRVVQTNTEAFVEEALTLLAAPEGWQGCVTSAAAVLGRTSDERATAALLSYVRAEVLRVDPTRTTFRGQNVSAVISALGRQWARARASHPGVRPETLEDYKALATLRETRTLTGDPAPERPRDVSERLALVKRFATEALAAGFEAEALPDFVARVLRSPRRPVQITVAPGAQGKPELRITNPPGARPISLPLQDSALPVAFDARQPDGSWREVVGWNWSSCGNSYFESAEIQTGETKAFRVRLPETGTPARMRARLKWRGVGTLQSLGGVTLSDEFDGFYDAEALELAAHYGRRLQNFGAPELRELAAGHGLPDVRAALQSQIRYDALRVLLQRRDLGLAEAVLPLLRDTALASEARPFVRQLCRQWPEVARPLMRAAIDQPDASNRRAILGAVPECKAFSALLPRLLLPDDPDLTLIVDLLRGRLEDGFWAPAADALARLVRNPEMPAAVADAAAKTVARYGRDAVHVGWSVVSGTLHLVVDARTEQSMQGCDAARAKNCLGFSLVDATGETVVYTPRPETATRLDGPQRLRFSVGLPEGAPDGRYRFVAEPGVHIDGLVVPDAFGFLRREAGRWLAEPR